MFETLSARAPDAIMDLMQKAKADTNPDKIDLGAGVYKTDNGVIPIMRAVKEAEVLHMAEETTKTYVGTNGNPAFRQRMTELVLGANHKAKGRIATAQGVGGSGALRLCAEVIKAANPDATVWVSTPTWANHTPLVGSTRLKFAQYPYYDKETMSVDFDAMMESLKTEPQTGDVILLHGCCHNPTGADLSQDQWDAVANLIVERGLIPFVDLAYAGLGHGFKDDLYGLHKIVETSPNVLAAISCSKNFGLYKERVGMAMIVTATEERAKIVESELGLIQRKLVSMPPDHGAAIVAKILGDETLHKMWSDELSEMQSRMLTLRTTLSDALSVQGGEVMARAVREQNGMFSTLALSKSQIHKLREQSIYMTDSGRINIAGANTGNIPRLADEILKIL